MENQQKTKQKRKVFHDKNRNNKKAWNTTENFFIKPKNHTPKNQKNLKLAEAMPSGHYTSLLLLDDLWLARPVPWLIGSSTLNFLW